MFIQLKDFFNWNRMLTCKKKSAASFPALIKVIFTCTGYETCQKVWNLTDVFRENIFYFDRTLACSCQLHFIELQRPPFWLHPFWTCRWSWPVRQSDKRPSVSARHCPADWLSPGLEQLLLMAPRLPGMSTYLACWCDQSRGTRAGCMIKILTLSVFWKCWGTGVCIAIWDSSVFS